MSTTAPHHIDWPHRILMVGGHQHIRGGLEIFLSRASDCLGIAAHCYTDTPSGGAQSIPGYLAGLWRFGRQLGSYDIVWLHYGSAFDLAYLLVAKLFGKRVAVTPHLGRSWRAMRNTVLRAACNRILECADTIFTLYKTQPAELEFPSALTRRCVVMPTFLPASLLETDTVRPPHAGSLRIVHVARLSAEKGSFAFLDTCSALRERGIPFEATIAGPADASVLEDLQAEIMRKAIPVTFEGPLPQDAVMDLLRRHDVLVNLSLQDAYPLTVIEALLCGVSPICCALPGTVEMASETAAILLVDGQDPRATADRILTVNQDAICDGIRQMQQKFSWHGLRARYHAAFADLATEASPRTDTTRANHQ